jgi:alginate O-acetyltransferase complex protein AlgI
MLFNSLHFLVFFVIVTSLYYAVPYKQRWFLLLASSCYFYMAFVPIYILILGFTIVVDYFAGLYIEKTDGEKRTLFLICSLFANIGILAIFKYYNFINENFSFLLHGVGLSNPLPYLNILLPIGLSFHTFQAMSYTIEVYNRRQKAERHFGIYSLYVMFYPQLVAGPIERPQNLLKQLRQSSTAFDYDRVTNGLKLMTWGMFKKVVIADRLAVVVETVYNDPGGHAGPAFTLATVCFAIQIYCDFSGYTDIAIGAARVMGVNLMANFRQPYFANSVPDFWRRWHISLSTWFRDYLYIPLGGRRVPAWRWHMNIFFVFLVCGLWHGANWTFVIWGALHGTYIVAYNLLTKPASRVADAMGLSRLPALLGAIKIVTTMALVVFAWIFFRANNVTDAFYIVRHLISGWGALVSTAGLRELTLSVFGHTDFQFVAMLAGIWTMLVAAMFVFESYERPREILVGRPWWVRWSVYLGLVSVILLLGSFKQSAFIYFQF